MGISTGEVIVASDIREAMLTINICDTEVFSGASPSTWTDLDLSGTVGANEAWALIRITAGASGLGVTAVRMDGDTSDYYASGDTTGIYRMSITANRAAVTLVPTSSSGIMEWKCEAAVASTTVDVIGYIK